MKYAIVTILLWMNSIQLCSSKNALCTADPTGMCSVIVDKIPDVFDQVQAIPDILDDVKDVLKIVEQIPEMFEVIMLLLENPFTVTDILPPDVNELAETLETCMDPVIDLLDPFSAMYEALLKNLPEIEIPDFIGELPDIDDLIYKALAFALLPYKEAVDKTCNSILPGAVNVLKTELTGYGRRRRMGEEIRPSEDGNDGICKGKAIEDYCESKPFEWTHDQGGLYEFETSHPFNSIIKDKSHQEKGNKVNVVIEHRIAKFTMNMINLLIDVVLFYFDETTPEVVKNVDGYNKLSKWQKQLADVSANKVGGLKNINSRYKYGKGMVQFGKTIKFFVVFVNQIIDYVMATAAQHNGVLERTKINAIFNDRIAILHNQKGILHTVKSGLIGTNAKIDTLIRYQQRFDETHGTLPPTSEPTVKKNYKLKDFNWAKEEVSIRNDEFGDATSFITITLGMRELYSLVAVTIGFGSLCIIIGIVIGKCCLNVYKTNGGFAPLPKYDYATSDVEDVSK